MVLVVQCQWVAGVTLLERAALSTDLAEVSKESLGHWWGKSFLGSENRTYNDLEAETCHVVEEQQGGKWRQRGWAKGRAGGFQVREQMQTTTYGALLHFSLYLLWTEFCPHQILIWKLSPPLWFYMETGPLKKWLSSNKVLRMGPYPTGCLRKKNKYQRFAHTENRPGDDAESRQLLVSHTEGPQRKPALLMPWSWASSLQNCRKIILLQKPWQTNMLSSPSVIYMKRTFC